MPLPAGMTPQAQKVLAVVAWAVVVWCTEAVPVGVTGLLIPLLLVITGAVPKIPEAFSGYSLGVSFLCLGAFIFAAIFQLARLDRRIALTLIHKIKANRVGRIIWGLFATNFVLALFIPASVARAATMLPIVNGILDLFGDSPEERSAKKAIAIQALVYATMICGVTILTAHMPNLIYVGLFEKQLGVQIFYFQWFILKCPLLLLFGITYFWVRWYFSHQTVEIPGGVTRVEQMSKEMGKTTKTEWLILIIFILIALGWASEDVHRVKTEIVTLIGIAIFFIPGVLPFSWKVIQARTIWGTWLLLCGALSMSAAMSQSGLAGYLANLAMPIAQGHHWMLILLIMGVATHIIRIGMLSNVAAIAMLAPVMLAMAPMLNLNPVAFTMLVCDVDTFAYLLPTQITAAVVAYSTNAFTTTDYAKVGIGAMILAGAFQILIMPYWYALNGFPLW
jgi:anion transporter